MKHLETGHIRKLCIKRSYPYVNFLISISQTLKSARNYLVAIQDDLLTCHGQVDMSLHVQLHVANDK